jgi:large subunit ribosomal protein L15
MQLHEARRAKLSNKKKVRVGRGPGSGLGKTAGRGIKGATSRSGYAMKVTYEGGQMPLFRRLPKRGFRNGPFRVTFTSVNVERLAAFAAGSEVGVKDLRQKGLAHGPKTMPVKILGSGELTVALTVTADAFSKSAIEKIEKAGGKVIWLRGAPKKKAPNFRQIEIDKKLAEKSKPKEEPKAEGKPEAKAEPKAGKPADAKAQAKPAEAKPAGEAKPEAQAPKSAEPKAEGKPDKQKAAPKTDEPKADEAAGDKK